MKCDFFYFRIISVNAVCIVLIKMSVWSACAFLNTHNTETTKSVRNNRENILNFLVALHATCESCSGVIFCLQVLSDMNSHAADGSWTSLFILLMMMMYIFVTRDTLFALNEKCNAQLSIRNTYLLWLLLLIFIRQFIVCWSYYPSCDYTVW